MRRDSDGSIALILAWLMILGGVILLFNGCGKPPESPRRLARQAIRAPWRPEVEGRKVLEDYGPLFVSARAIEEGEAREELRPWSSYFFPIKDPILFGDAQGKLREDSPLGKYDAFTRKRTGGTPKSSAQWEKKAWDLGGRNAQSWEGLCNAWAFASLLEPAPREPRTVNGISFSVGDLKALLVKSYEASEVEVHYGRNFEAGPEADWNTIYPEEFHRFVQAELYQRRRPFIMDSDPTEQIWNYPVWAGKSEILPDATDPTRVHVHTQLLAAGSLRREDRDETAVPPHPFEYWYDLVGEPQEGGSIRVVYGEWTGDSRRKSHPNYLIPIPQKITRVSSNPELDPKLIDEILGRSGT